MSNVYFSDRLYAFTIVDANKYVAPEKGEEEKQEEALQTQQVWHFYNVVTIANNRLFYSILFQPDQSFTFRRQIDIMTYKLFFFLPDTSLCLFDDEFIFIESS